MKINQRAFFVFTAFLISSSSWASSSELRGVRAHLPLRFETVAAGKLAAREGPYSLLLEPGQTTVTMSDRQHHTSAAVKTRLAGANLEARPEGTDLLAARATYLHGNDPAAWRSNAPLFARVAYHSVYPGIDLVFHGATGSLEYDFVVQPGGNARQIAMDIEGASDVRLEPDGQLAIATPAGEIHWKRPEIYQMKDGVRQPVRGAFRVHGSRVTFALGAYNHSRELVIDPTLTYATYLGGSDNDSSRGVAVDRSGNMYVTGLTFSLNLPQTGGTFQPAYKGGTFQADLGGDAFVAKYTSAGALVYVTYLGGRADDIGTAIAVDSGGNAYVTGYTSSSDFPTTPGAYQTRYRGASAPTISLPAFGDAFVAKLKPDGSGLVYSTFLGGSLDDKGAAIAVDNDGNAYVGGTTLSTDFPTKNAYQSSFKGSGGIPNLCSNCGPIVNFGDGFLAKLNPAGSDLVYSTYLGGKLDDSVTCLAVDNSGNVYVGGATLSADFPVLNPIQKTYGGTASDNAQPVLKTGDGFVAKFKSDGTLTYSTYLGGSGDDAVMGIAIDSTSAAYVTGFTSSANFPGVAANSAQKTFTGPSSVHDHTGFVWGDAFVAKLAPSGSSLIYATYLGGTNDDAGMAIAVDAAGDAIVGGFAMSTDLRVTADALQKTFAGSGPSFFTDPTGDCFLAKVSPDGSAFLYLSYFGGNKSEAITAVALDAQGNVIVAGTTTSTNLPTTANAAQKTFAGEDPDLQTEDLGDAFVAVFSGLASAATAPVITSVVNSASFTSSIAPGTNVNVLGTNLPASASAGALVGGKTATVIFASATQWTVSIPTAAVTGPSTIQVGTSAPFNINISQYAPALYSNTSDPTIVAAQRANGAIVSSSAPALPGDIISVFATGLGAVDANGHPTPLPVVTVGGQPVTVSSAALSNTGPGIYQINFQLPATQASGNQAVVLSIGGVNSPALNLPVGALVQTGPVITDVQNGASFAPGVVANAWLTIKGSLLSTVTDDWSKSVVNGNLPTTLDGVSVKVGGQPAYVYFVSPGQINVVAPNIPAGPTTVTVTNSSGTGTANAVAQIYGPAFFLWPGGYAVATRQDFSFAVKDGTFGVTTIAAKPGDVLILWGTGFGPTTPPAPVGVAIPPNQYVVNGVTVTIGGVAATVFGTALASGSAALYQVAIQVPASLADGDYPLVASVNGASSPTTTLITIRH